MFILDFLLPYIIVIIFAELCAILWHVIVSRIICLNGILQYEVQKIPILMEVFIMAVLFSLQSTQ